MKGNSGYGWCHNSIMKNTICTIIQAKWYNTPHGAPLERGDWTHRDSIDIALLWSADARRDRILLTFRSSGSRKETPTRTCYLLKELFRKG